MSETTSCQMNYYPLWRTEVLPQAVILAAGTFPRSGPATLILQEAPVVVCCDGAAEKLIQYGRVPDAIVGDGDSLSADLRQKYAGIIQQEKEQDTNDLSKAFRYCLRQGWTDLLIVGATGEREDHTVGNISLLMDYRQQARVQMLTDYGLFTPVEGDGEFESFPGEQVSVFNMGCSRLKGEGLVYPLSPFTNWWQGTLNEARSDSFRIYTDGQILVYRVLK